MIELNKIYNGNCLDILKQIDSNSIDLIFTDPPYGLSYNNNDLASQREKVFGGKLSNMKPRPIENDKTEQKADELLCKMLVEVNRILKPGCCCCCCGGGGPKPLFARWTLYLDKYIGFNQAVVWDKGGLGMGIRWRRSYEFVLVAQKKGGKMIWNGGKTTSNIIKIPKIIPKEFQHPTEKPVRLSEFFIKLLSNKDGIVVDPFAGAGSVLIASKISGRNFIGIEIDNTFFQMAEKKLKQINEVKINMFDELLI